MKIFYTRTESGSEIVVTYKYRALFYWVLGLAFAAVLLTEGLSISSGLLNNAIILVVVGFFIVYIFDLRQVNREVGDAMRRGSVTLSGSRFSLSNPIKAVIKK